MARNSLALAGCGGAVPIQAGPREDPHPAQGSLPMTSLGPLGATWPGKALPGQVGTTMDPATWYDPREVARPVLGRRSRGGRQRGRLDVDGQQRAPTGPQIARRGRVP